VTAARARARIVVSGRVQGVAFRAHAVREATRLGVTGWVRNLSDGRVEAVAEGARDAVDAFAAWCRRGPPGARVDGASVAEEPHRGEFLDFDVRFDG
jgi:acylphosphatase